MNPIGYRVIRYSLIFALAAALSSCISFSNGLVENPMPVDGRLIGFWQIVGKDGKGALLIDADGPSVISATAFEDATCTKPERFSATRTEIAGHEFLDISGMTSGGKIRLMSPIDYEFADSNHLSLFLPDSKIFEQAVTAGELSGNVTKERVPFDSELKKGEYPSVKVDASTADLRKWIAVHHAAMQPFAEFERRELSLAPQCGSDHK